MSGIRMTGLISGMDTEGMVQELVKASSVKVDNVRKVVVCHYADNEVASALLKKLNFVFSNKDFSSVNGKQVLRYTKNLD